MKKTKVKKAAKAKSVTRSAKTVPSVVVYSFLKASDQPTSDGKSLSPQAKAIVDAVQAAPDGKMTRQELLKALKTVLGTNQTPSRVLSYYKKPLTVTTKYLKVEKVLIKAKQVVQDVPAPAPVVAPAPAAVAPTPVAAPAPAAAPVHHHVAPVAASPAMPPSVPSAT